MIANLLRTGDLVRINPKSRYYNYNSQLPEGRVGKIKSVRSSANFYIVEWSEGTNSYNNEDLILIGFNEYLKRL